MAGLFGGDLALDRHSEQGKVTDDVEDLVADEFVVESERRFVEHSVTATGEESSRRCQCKARNSILNADIRDPAYYRLGVKNE